MAVSTSISYDILICLRSKGQLNGLQIYDHLNLNEKIRFHDTIPALNSLERQGYIYSKFIGIHRYYKISSFGLNFVHLQET